MTKPQTYKVFPLTVEAEYEDGTSAKKKWGEDIRQGDIVHGTVDGIVRSKAGEPVQYIAGHNHPNGAIEVDNVLGLNMLVSDLVGEVTLLGVATKANTATGFQANLAYDLQTKCYVLDPAQTSNPSVEVIKIVDSPFFCGAVGDTNARVKIRFLKPAGAVVGNDVDSDPATANPA